MTKPKSELWEIHQGYEIRYRPWLKRRPWRCQLPGRANRWCDVASLAAARTLIDRQLILQKSKSK